MAMTETSPAEAVSEAADDGEVAPATTNPVAEFFGSSDHRTVGKMFVVASLLFLAIDLVVAAVGSFDLARPEATSWPTISVCACGRTCPCR